MKLVSLLPYFALVFFVSCSGIKDPDFKDIEHLRVDKLGFNKSSLRMDLKYNNPNKFGMRLTRAEGDAWLDENSLGHFTLDTIVVIGPNEDFWIPVKLELDMSKVLKNSILALLGSEVNLKVEGKARINKGVISVNYPFNYSGKHKVSEFLK